jgi:hypothetical protein
MELFAVKLVEMEDYLSCLVMMAIILMEMAVAPPVQSKITMIAVDQAQLHRNAYMHCITYSFLLRRLPKLIQPMKEYSC